MSVIPLDVKEIKQQIQDSSEYTSKSIRIQAYSNLFLASLSNTSSSYTGFLSQELTRTSLGLQTYPNGDSFLGFWENSSKQAGIYRYSSPIAKQMNIGKWKDDQRTGLGTHIWLSEAESNKKLENSEFELFHGLFSKGAYVQGAYLIKKEGNYSVYFGLFKDFNRDDEKALFYDNRKDRVFRGCLAEDKIIKGFLISFNSDDVYDVNYLDFNQNAVKAIIPRGDIDEETQERISGEGAVFRRFLLEKDWFGIFYSLVKQAESLCEESRDIEDFKGDAAERLKRLVRDFEEIGMFEGLVNLLGC